MIDEKKLIERLEEEKSSVPVNRMLDDIINDKPKELGQLMAYSKTIKIVNQLAEEYKHCNLCYLGSPCEYQNADADCEKCESYDTEKHYCPKFCYVIENTIKEIEENHDNDFCEWKELSVAGITVVKEPHRMKLLNHDREQQFCPYCGKKIKITPYLPKGDNNG